MSDTTPLLMTAHEDELPGLAGKLAREMHMLGVYYCRKNDIEPLGAQHFAEQAKQLPPQELDWHHLSAVCAQDEAEALSLWGEVKEFAHKELRSGDRAWKAVAPPQSTPLDRARFMVLRQKFMEDWKPSGAIEATLVEQIAQMLTMQFYWQEKLTQRTHEQAARGIEDQAQARKKAENLGGHYRGGEWIPERVTEKEMIAEASANADRYNRTFVRLLRTLRDLRRYNVVIQNAGQVNIADKQVNVGEKQGNTASPAKAPAKKRRARGLRMAS